jgi:hypothetical protein
MSSSDGDDPTKKEPDPGATLAGGYAPKPKAVPPPRSVPGAAPYRPSQPAAPYQPPGQTPAGHPVAPHQPAAPQQPVYQQPAAPQQPAYPQQPVPQSYSQQVTQPSPSPFAVDPAASPYASGGTPAPQLPPAAQHIAVPNAPMLESESSPIEKVAEVARELPGRFTGFLKISAKRAFRLRIEPTEVLSDEREELERANPPVTETNLMAFLAWRRSVLFLVATILTILSIMGLIDVFIGKHVSSPVRFVKLLPTLAECVFCAICWLSLKYWTQWRKQRKWLLIGWLLFMLTPFVVFLYPLKAVVMGTTKALSIQQMNELGWYGTYNKAIAPFAFAMIAMLQLAPKVISLMPGLIRSAMVTKLLFPGTSAPGWLIVFCAPLYAMIAYAILVIPYQFTGEPWFMFGVVMIMFAQLLVMRSGFHLARPLTEEETIKHLRIIRKFYLVLLIIAAISIIGGLGLLVKLLNMKWTSVVTTLLKFEANVMILTTIGTDLVITNLDRARHYTEGKEQIEAETEKKISEFVGLNAPQA